MLTKFKSGGVNPLGRFLEENINIDYRSFSDLNQAIVESMYKFPKDIDLVVGLPRSGMLPANLIALYLNKPYTDIDSFIEGRVYGMGDRGDLIAKKKFRKILIMDDSVYAGNALKKAKAKLSSLDGEYEFIFAAVFAHKNSMHLVDIFCACTGLLRVFQWNFFHHSYVMKNSCFDLDGVLCQDPVTDDDGPIYEEFLKTATPLHIPSVPIGTIVTCRLEKYRALTETWLAKHNVRYDELVMLPFATREERIAWGKYGEYKAAEYLKRTDKFLFVESSYEQAVKISQITHKPVFCIETFSMMNYQQPAKVRAVRKILKKVTPKPVKRAIEKARLFIRK